MYKLKRSVFFKICLCFLTLYIKISFASPVLDSQKKYLLLLEATVNKKKIPGIFKCYEDYSGDIWVEENDLVRWGFPKVKKNSFFYFGKNYYSLKWYPSIHYYLNKKRLKISIWLPPQYFLPTYIDLSGYNPTPFRAQQGGAFLNYDIAIIKNSSMKICDSAYVELGSFQSYGVGTTDVLISNYNEPHSHLSNSHRIVRLNTTWTFDQPEKIATWRFGDSITGACAWSNSIRFAGIQYATNFSTQPNLITFPLPNFKGEAIMPTNVQIFVNNVLNQNRMIEGGMYRINNIPAITGAGTVNVVTKDLLGRTQLFYFPYYASPTLLQPDLNNYSYEMGFIRENYGINSNDYHDFFAMATYQKGLTNFLTVTTHLEALLRQQTLGISFNYLFNNFAILSTALSASHSQLGDGWCGSIGLNRQTQKINFGFTSTYTSKKYQQMGMQRYDSVIPPGIITHQIFYGYDAGDFGSIGLSYTKMNLFNDIFNHYKKNIQYCRIATLNYTRNAFKNVSFLLNVVKNFQAKNGLQAYAALIFSLDNSHTVNAYLNYQNKQTYPGILYTKNLPLGNGYGYQLLATNSVGHGIGADFTYQNNIGTYTFRAYQSANKSYYQAYVSGAAIYFDKHLGLSRHINQSFALVEIPGYENVRVYYQNQLIGKTNHRGNVLVPELLAYQENYLAIEPRDLPLTAAIEKINDKVIPSYRSGAVAKFNVKNFYNVFLRLIQVNGKFVPVGAKVIINNMHYRVGYDGILFFSIQDAADLQGKVFWRHHRCDFVVPKNNKQSFSAQKVLCISKN